MTKDVNSRLIDVTVAEAFELVQPMMLPLIQEAVEKAVAALTDEKEVYGIPGIRKLLGNCSYSKAMQVKNSGILDPAITQNGRKITVDVKLAKQLLKENSLI